METITTVGLDLAKSVFQVHAVAGDGAVLVRRTLRRSQVLTFFSRLAPCLVGMEACGSAHYWAREITVWIGTGFDADRRATPLIYNNRTGSIAVLFHV
jgi:hypothetical protein